MTKKKKTVTKRRIGGVMHYNPAAVVDMTTYKNALKEVNHILTKKLKRKPVKKFPLGVAMDCTECPIGQVLNARLEKPRFYVEGDCVYDMNINEPVTFHQADVFGVFTEQFDQNAYKVR